MLVHEIEICRSLQDFYILFYLMLSTKNVLLITSGVWEKSILFLCVFLSHREKKKKHSSNIQLRVDAIHL